LRAIIFIGVSLVVDRPPMSRPMAASYVAATLLKFIALCIFASGFLLTRRESDAIGARVATADGGAIVDKVVVLIIDGARYDWSLDDASLEGNHPAGRKQLTLPTVRRYGSTCVDADGKRRRSGEDKGRGKVFKFIADAPTTTQQRLKGLLTGGLPTFIDVSASFGGTSLREDNVVSQLHRAGKRMAISGDDTWAELFDVNATFGVEAAMYPSFDVKDTETVDAGVRYRMNEALARPQDWDVLIGHMLGADHVGHTHGATTDAMRTKLAQNDVDIENIIDAMRSDERFENSLLLVFGDHGMTDNGDHGGGTAEEVESFLLAYHPWAKHDVSCTAEDEILPQIDFAPTLATLLGVPIPHGNLGRVNQQILSLGHAKDVDRVHAEYLYALHENSEQIWNYISTYGDGKHGPFSSGDMLHLGELMKISRANRLLDSDEFVVEFMDDTAATARAKWAQFGLVRMTLGFIALVGSLVVHAVLAYNVGVRDVKGGVVDIGAVVGVGMVVLVSLSRLSNSFIIAERDVMQFFFATFVTISTCWTLRRKTCSETRILGDAGKALFANAILSALGASWVKSDATNVKSLTGALALLSAYSIIGVSFVELRKNMFERYNGRARAFDCASLAWLFAALRSVAVTMFDSYGIWLARLVYVFSASGIIAHALNQTNYAGKSVALPSVSHVVHGPEFFLVTMAPTIAMLAGPISGVIYVASAYALLRGLKGVVTEPKRSVGTETALATGMWLASSVLFFGGGHACSFDGLHFAAAYTGFEKFHFYIMGFLLGFETWSSEIMLAASIPIFARAISTHRESTEATSTRLALKISLFRAIAVTFSTLCAALHRRHLMVWAIFAPKFVFESIGSSVADACALLSIALNFWIPRRLRARASKRD